jgi:hypothetical protein
MHAAPVTIHILDPLVAVPGVRVLCHEKPPRRHPRSLGDPLHQTATSKPVVVTTEPMVLEEEHERGRGAIRLAKKRVIGRNAIGPEKQDRETESTMAVVQFVVSLQNLKEPERVDSRERVSGRWDLAGCDVRSPGRGQLTLRESHSLERVISAKSPAGMRQLRFQLVAGYPIVGVDEAVGGVRRTVQLTGWPSVPEPG